MIFVCDGLNSQFAIFYIDQCEEKFWPWLIVTQAVLDILCFSESLYKLSQIHQNNRNCKKHTVEHVKQRSAGVSTAGIGSHGRIIRTYLLSWNPVHLFSGAI